MIVKIRSENGVLPSYETEGSAGMDIRAFTMEPIVIMPGERKLIPTGLYIDLPQGYEAQIRARSGLSIKNGITLVNGIGTIDSDYRGEIKVPLINLGDEPFSVKNGDRVAQMIIARYERITWQNADELSSTQRGSGGFGHTGV